MDDHSYWEFRGSLAYQYKGETFYTVTPIPYYYQRRTALLNLLGPIFAQDGITNICDFGCGDGWYLGYFANRHPTKHWYGVDISMSMIERAKQICPQAILQTSEDGITFDLHFDLIYAIAMFAHVSDKLLETLFANIHQKLQPGGRFILFEATGPERRDGSTYCRRTTQEYIDYAAKCGFSIDQRYLIAFPFHRFFEKKLAHYYRKLFAPGQNHYESCIKANRQFLYRFLSLLLCKFTLSPVRPDLGKQDGNSLYILKK